MRTARRGWTAATYGADILPIALRRARPYENIVNGILHMSDRDAWTTYAERLGLVQADQAPVSRPNKYGAVAVYVDGVRFDSRKEAARYLELVLLAKAGRILSLELHPAFPLHIMELWRTGAPIRLTTVGRYTADFQYCDRETGEIVIEDVKSDPTRTEAYALRRRLAECIHGIHVREV